MARLIDADALLFELANESFPQSCTYAQGRNGVIDSIRNAPTIDAVPVVRCKDCIWNGNDHHFCYRWSKGDNDYCSKGERKDNEID